MGGCVATTTVRPARRSTLKRPRSGRPPSSPACEKITAVVEANKAKAPKVGTLDGLIQSYYETEHFKNLSPATRRDYRQCANFLEPIRDTPIHTIDPPLVAGIHDKAAMKIGWRRANMLRTLLSEVFRFAIPKALISANFCHRRHPEASPRQPRLCQPAVGARGV